MTITRTRDFINRCENDFLCVISTKYHYDMIRDAAKIAHVIHCNYMMSIPFAFSHHLLQLTPFVPENSRHTPATNQTPERRRPTVRRF